MRPMSVMKKLHQKNNNPESMNFKKARFPAGSLESKLNIPSLGNYVPRRDNVLSRTFGKFILFVTGWRMEGEVPNHPKFIIIGAPHTSNWDAVYGFAAIFALRLRINWMAKHTLFKKPFRSLLTWMGGVPVDRTASHGVVDQTIAAFEKREQFIIAITPEGTRKKVNKWKTGFYYIALKAKVPIVMGFLDYSRKALGFGPLIHPTGNIDADMEKIQSFYSKIKPKRPENFNVRIA